MQEKDLPNSVEIVPSRQFSLRAVLLAVTVIPPLVGGLGGALGPYVQAWLWLALGIPALALTLLALTFAVCYVLFVLPVISLAKGLQALWNIEPYRRH